PAAGARSKHDVVVAMHGASLFVGQNHSSASHAIASRMYGGIPVALLTWRALTCANRAFPKRIAVFRTESRRGGRIFLRASSSAAASRSLMPFRNRLATVGAPISSAAAASISSVSGNVIARSNVVLHLK